MTRFPPLGGRGSIPVAEKDVTKTFSETDVTVTTSAATVSSGSVQLTSSTATTGADNTSLSDSSARGLRFNPNGDAEAITATISANCSGFTTAYVEDDAGNTLASKDVSGLVAGNSFTISGLNLKAGTDYGVLLDAGGASWTWGRYDTPSFPYTSECVDILSTTRGDGYDYGAYRDAITDVSLTAKSGTAYVEWGAPTDIFSWDVATFTRTLDGESVDVYLEESTDGGSTWSPIAGPISRGDSIPASSPSANVRFRVELARASTANNPTIDSLARRWKL